jgi:formyltetrahydrofolate-dependent phosphoribosylglycinamide formyltransferase
MNEGIIASAEEVAGLSRELGERGERLVFTNGCFDLLHVGHVRYLQAARATGDALVVALNGDESVRKLKGPGRPVQSAEDRAEILRALGCVDAVVVFEEERVTDLILKIRPQIYAKGGDYTVETLNVEERGALEEVGTAIEILPLVEGKSTSEILKKKNAGEGGEAGTLKLGILGSGVGSNFEAICEAIDEGRLDAEVAIVISDSEEAAILGRASRRGIPWVAIDSGPYETKFGAPAQKEACDRLKAAGVDMVVLAGFMRLVKEPILSAFEGRILNIHPSLLPAFKGYDAWGQALAAGVKESGCTVHRVTADVDGGEILGQARVPVVEGDTAESLRERIHEAEHELYPRVIGEVLGAKGFL